MTRQERLRKNAREYRARQLAKDPEGFRAKEAEANKRYREKLRDKDPERYVETFSSGRGYKELKAQAEASGRLEQFLERRRASSRAYAARQQAKDPLAWKAKMAMYQIKREKKISR